MTPPGKINGRRFIEQFPDSTDSKYLFHCLLGIGDLVRHHPLAADVPMIGLLATELREVMTARDDIGPLAETWLRAAWFLARDLVGGEEHVISEVATACVVHRRGWLGWLRRSGRIDELVHDIDLAGIIVRLQPAGRTLCIVNVDIAANYRKP